MIERELIIQALWRRLNAVVGVETTARNPVNAPKAEDMPCINFFELQDSVTAKSYRGKSRLPSYKREFEVVVECFIEGSKEPAASKELGLFIQAVKKVLYTGGVDLGIGGVEVTETGAGRVLRVPELEKVAGLGIVLSIRYVEDTAKLFA